MAKLGDICTFQSGGTPSKSNSEYFNGSIPWITTVALTGDYIDKNDAVDWITDKAIQESAAKIVPENSILVGTRVGIGKVAINTVPMSTSQDIVSLINVDDTEWDKRFLCKVISARNPYLLSQARGATIKGIKIDTLAKLEIPKIPLNEQRRIAAVLDKVSDLIAKRREQLDKLGELVKARFVEMFGDPLLDSGKYPKVPLGSLTEVGSSKRIFEKEYVSEGVPFYRTKEIVELSKGNRITTELFITRERYDEICREYGVPQTGDLLISAVGTIGVIWIVDGKNDFYFKDGNLLRVATSEKFVPIYLKYLLESLIGAYKLEMSSGTAYAALTISTLKEILVYEVPLAEQEQFGIFVKQIDKSKLTIQQSLDKLEVLKKALMQQYFG